MRMRRRRMMLTLLAVALPTAALANSLSFTTGSFDRGTMARTASGGFVSLSVNIVGDTTRMILSGGTLSAGCNPANNGSGMCTFSGATLRIENPINSMVLFTDSGVSGSISKMPHGAVIKGILPKDSALPGGGSVSLVVSFNSTSPYSPNLLGGSGVALAPEPSALEGLLLGTGLLGLVELARRKLKLGNARLGLAP